MQALSRERMIYLFKEVIGMASLILNRSKSGPHLLSTQGASLQHSSLPFSISGIPKYGPRDLLSSRFQL